VVGVAVAAGVAGWWVGLSVKSPADAAAEHQPPPPSLITVPVQKKALTSTSVAQGSVVYTGESTVNLTGLVGATGATQLVTKAPVAGTTLNPGDVLMEVSGRPVFVLAGPVPMYRTLELTAKGDDVKQLQAGLTALRPGVRLASGLFDAPTATAVKAWYERAGYQVAPGDDVTIPSGEILFLPALPARLDTVSLKAGDPATGKVGTVTDPTVVVRATMPSADAQLVRTGLPASLKMPDGTALPATVDALGKDAAPPVTAAPSAENAAPPTSNSTNLRLVAQDPAALAGYAGQPVKIEIEVGSSGGEVLVVPVAAVTTKADGKARVQVQAADGALRDVPVALGLTVLGLVEVDPADGGQLQAGDRVVVGTS